MRIKQESTPGKCSEDVDVALAALNQLLAISRELVLPGVVEGELEGKERRSSQPSKGGRHAGVRGPTEREMTIIRTWSAMTVRTPGMYRG